MQDKNILASILFSFIGLLSMAQEGVPPPPAPPPPPGLPIDGGVLALFFFAMVYGAYKINQFSKNKT